MKKLFFTIATASLFLTSCSKAPEGVKLTSDKTTYSVGETIELTATDEESGLTWFSLNHKKPSSSDFTSNALGGVSGLFSIEAEEEGTYTFFTTAYSEDCYLDEGVECDKSTNSEEISVTVTP